MLRQRGSTSITMPRKPPTGRVRLTRFTRQRLTACSLTRFMMSVGCKGPKVRRPQRSPSTRPTPEPPRRRALRLLSRVRSRTVCSLQINKAKLPRERRFRWRQRRREKARRLTLPVSIKLLNRHRTNLLREQARRQSNQYRNPRRVPAHQQPRRKLQRLRRRMRRLPPTNRITSRPLSKRARPRSPLCKQHLPKSRRCFLVEEECGLSRDYFWRLYCCL